MKHHFFYHVKKWGSIAIVFIVIVCISGALPNYLTPPSPQTQQTVEKDEPKKIEPAAKIGHLALVNEDQGADMGSQHLNLGNQVAPLFREDHYQWENVSRSTADNGLKQGVYQAAIYIPSDFTENIFTYDRQKPKAAVISYQSNPKLTAEESAKMQTEFQKVRGTLNQEFSKIYWRLVADKINYVNSNFAAVLQKDRQFLQAMSDFYKPSSKDMAQVFESQLNQVNDLLDQTNRTSEEAATRQESLTETKKQISDQLEALNKLNVQMKEQIHTLQKTRDTNKQLVDDAIAKSQDGLNEVVDTFKSNMASPLKTSVTIDDPLKTSEEFTDLDHLFAHANTRLTHVNTQATNQIMDISNDYPDDPDDLIPTIDELVTQINHAKEGVHAALMDTDDESSVSEQVKTLNDQAISLFDEAKRNYETAQDLYHQAYGQDGETPSLYDKVDVYYNEALNLYKQALKREGIGQDQYQKYQDFFQAMTTVALNNVQSDISTLEQISKPEVITDTENGKDGPALLKSIGDIQNEIGNQNNGLANNANITKFDLDLSKIDDDADFSEESLFIDTDPNKNYRESELRSYQLLLMNTKNSLSNLLKMVTTFQPVQPVYSDLIQPDDPALSAPEDMELTEPERPDSVELGGAFDQTGSWMEQVTGQLISSLYGLDGINKEAQTVDQRETMNDTEKSIQGQYDHAIKQYNDALDIQKAELEKAQNVLLNNMSHMQQQVENVAKPLVLTEPDPTFKDVDKGFVLSFKSNTFNELNTIEEGIQSIADSQSAILKSSQDVRSLVNGVQSDANQLSGNWGQNVEATAQLGHAIARTLGNTGEPGNRNPSAYQQLVSPVNLAGLQPGGPNNIAEAEHDDPADTSTDAAPTEQPFLTLLAVLVASILIGYFSYHYRNLSRILNVVISSLLALVSSAAIVAYGITQYGLEGSGVIMWSFFTLGLIAVISVWVREAWQISDMVGVLLITGLIVYFTLPLLKNSLERFAYQNPAADVYLSIAYGEASFLFLEGMVALAVLMIPALAVIGIREVIHHIKEEKAHESETL